MKQGKLFALVLVLIILFLAMLSGVSLAAGSVTVTPVSMRSSGYQYLARNMPVWSFGSGGRTLYCLRGGPGFGATSDMGETTGSGSMQNLTSRTYTEEFNLKNPNSIPAAYKAMIPTPGSSTYNQLMWLLNNIYVPCSDAREQDHKTSLLEHATGYDIGDVALTDDDIAVVQQLAIWYFNSTNPTRYHSPWIQIAVNPQKGTPVQSIRDFIALGDCTENGEAREEDADSLYQFLLTQAENNSSYNIGNGEAPIEFGQTTPTVQTVGSDYIVGPFKLKAVNDLTWSSPYIVAEADKGTPKVVVKSGNNYVDAGIGNSATVAGYVIEETELYIKIPKSAGASQVTFYYKYNYLNTDLKFWSVNSGSYNLANEQPLIEPVRSFIDDEDEITVNIQVQEDKEIDLALRKSITKLGTTTHSERLPNVDVSNLIPNGSKKKTAKYNHDKNDLETTTGELVEYTITVYNEGEVNAYAPEIKDYLPAGIEFVKIVSDASKYSATVTNNADGSSVVTITNNGKRVLNKFAAGMSVPDSEAVVIQCRVTATPDQTNEKRLVNIAEISKYYNAEENKEVTQDRDSQPNNFPNNYKYNPNYNGNGQDGKYIPGQQDDDDFEPLILNPVVPQKKMDLALRKSITKLGDTVHTERLPNVDITNLTPNGQKKNTAKYNHSKTDLNTMTGELIEYTITVYNEGEKDAYALEIKDYLPAGIEFVELVSDTSKYSATVTNNTDGSSVVTITNKGKTVLRAFNGTKLESESFVIRCRITATQSDSQAIRLVNIAEISKYYDAEDNKEVSKDRDSEPENFPDGQKNNPSYNGNGQDGQYIPGQQDDDDFEPVVIPKKGQKIFDLALRKFIIKVGNLEYKDEGGNYLRAPVPDITNLRPNGTKQKTAVYIHSKKAVPVKVGDEVIYMFRVYNEGEVDGYANEIKDYLPSCLEFLPLDDYNTSRGWTYYKDENQVTHKNIIVTDYLSEARDADENLIRAFDGQHLDYKEVSVKCKVVQVDNMPSKITNLAEITKDSGDDDDSVPDDETQPSDENFPDYRDDRIKKDDDNVPGDEDDDDVEKLILQEFDLALRKFITKIGDTQVTDRVPVFTIENGKYVYKHTKEPKEVDTGDVVEYTIRVYNEGNMAGYAAEIEDDIPSGLQYLPKHATNELYKWEMLDKNGNVTQNENEAVTVRTRYLSQENEQVKGQYLLKAFDPDKMSEPAHLEVKIAFKVIAPNNTEGIITNRAQITDDTDEDGNPVDDKDSTPDEWIGTDDDQDVEHIKLTIFDLALRKFITGVNNTQITNREPKFAIENGKYVYKHTKDPVSVENGNVVEYTIRVYNEGTKAGYAKEVADDIPQGLEFVPDHETNKKYGWKMYDKNGVQTNDPKQAVTIKTNYLSKDNESTKGEFLLKPFDPKNMSEPHHLDIKVAFKVVEPNTSDRIVINQAQITDDTDEDGNPVVDEDSTPDEWIDTDDDQDIEKIKVKYFDLALKKWVTQAIIIEDGKETVIESGHTGDENPEPPVKVEVVAKKINKVVIKFRFKIKVTNEGEIAGYATEISDYIPAGLKFIPADNPNWQEVDGKVVTDQLKDTRLEPGQSAEVEILLTWINGKDNFGLKTNVAEISKDRNDSNTPDIDSTPNNVLPDEDDIDDAPVVLSVKTGGNKNHIEIIGTTIGVLVILISGTVLIKKYIL